MHGYSSSEKSEFLAKPCHEWHGMKLSTSLSDTTIYEKAL